MPEKRFAFERFHRRFDDDFKVKKITQLLDDWSNEAVYY
jgi:hypothetical protein